MSWEPSEELQRVAFNLAAERKAFHNDVTKAEAVDIAIVATLQAAVESGELVPRDEVDSHADGRQVVLVAKWMRRAEALEAELQAARKVVEACRAWGPNTPRRGNGSTSCLRRSYPQHHGGD